MELIKRTYSVLVVSASEKFYTTAKSLLPAHTFGSVELRGDIASAKRLTAERQFDIVIVNCPLPDETGLKFAIDISKGKNTAAMIVVGTDVVESISQKAINSGVYLLTKPLTAKDFNRAVDWLMTTRERLRSFEKKMTSIEDRMEEIRLVNRAKWILIDNLKMTEETAHKFIEKQAMDRGMTKGDVAESIINTYK